MRRRRFHLDLHGQDAEQDDLDCCSCCIPAGIRMLVSKVWVFSLQKCHVTKDRQGAKAVKALSRLILLRRQRDNYEALVQAVRTRRAQRHRAGRLDWKTGAE